MVRIDVVIRNPNAHGEVDFQMEAQDNQTVLDLKTRLQKEYPTQPSVKAQTLIHGGRVLRDDSKLCDVVSKYHEAGPRIFHLIVKGAHLTRPAPPPPEPEAASGGAAAVAAERVEADAPGAATLGRLQSAPAAVQQNSSAPHHQPVDGVSAPPSVVGAVPPSDAEAHARAVAAAEAEAQYRLIREAAHAQAQFLSQQQNAYAHYYRAAMSAQLSAPHMSPYSAAMQAQPYSPPQQQYTTSTMTQPQSSLSPGLVPQPYPTSPGLVPQPYPTSPGLMPQQYPSSPQGYPMSPQQYPLSPGAQMVYTTPYNSPWIPPAAVPHMDPGPPPLSLDEPTSQVAAQVHTASVAADAQAAATAAAAMGDLSSGLSSSSPILAAAAAAAATAATSTSASDPAPPPAAELRQRLTARNYSEEEEPLRGGGEHEGAAGGTAAGAAAVNDGPDEAAAAPDDNRVVDALAGAPEDENRPAGHWYGVIKFFFMLFVFFNDLDAVRLLIIIGSACCCYLYAYGYLNFVGRAIFGQHGPPRPRLARAYRQPPQPEPQPQDQRGAEAAAAGEADAGARESGGGGGDNDAVADAGRQADANDGDADGQANAPADHAQGGSSPHRLASDAVAAPPAVVEPPPLSFLGMVSNVCLAFVTSLFPAWEAV